MAMSTTLVTFLFECPVAARTVELLGSWDNFAKPYPLKRDGRRGHGIWSGCYTFDDIICDGDLSDLGSKRTGALKMGGTYWYYYNVDDEERHNPSEPSTTVCPLLPGQRLNVLEVPRETRSRSNSESSDAFTRNPQDKFLTPVPPKPLLSPRLGDLCRETYTVPMRPLGGPRSATYPSTGPALSPGFERHARSASTTPQITSTALFTDFKGIKEKLVQKRSASSTRSRSAGVRELEISAPTLISTTAEEVNLVPLSSLQPPSTASTTQTPHTARSLPPPVTAKLREFSPLGSHPVDPVKDLNLLSDLDRLLEREQQKCRPRSRSDVPAITATEFGPKPRFVRANSADARRTKLFSNEPWLSSPILLSPREPKTDSSAASVAPAPILRRPSPSLAPPADDVRPSSSHGGDRSSGLRKMPMDKDKELPALPRYLVPAPLFACNNEAASPELQQEVETQEEQEIEEEPQPDPADIPLVSGVGSRFSAWSTESVTLSSPTSDEDAIHSPTFSSLTSNCSENGSMKRSSARFSIGDFTSSPERTSVCIDEEDDHTPEDEESSFHLSASPPRLDELRISSFGPSLFNLDIHHADAAPRRQAACFGLGFQSYQLPEDDASSKVTIDETTLRPEPAIQHDRGSSVSHLEKLVNEFGFLGDSVI